MVDWAREVRYLRQKAQQFRELATEYETVISKALMDIAEELDRRADEIEQREGS